MSRGVIARAVGAGIAGLLAIAGCSSTSDQITTIPATEPQPRTPPTPADLDFDAVQENIMRELLLRDPEWLSDTALGEELEAPGHDLLTDVSTLYQTETARLAAQYLSDLEAARPIGLGGDAALRADILEWYLADVVEGAQFLLHDSPINFITGVHTNLPEFMADIHPLASERDAEDYLSRLAKFGEKLDSVRAGLAERRDAGVISDRGSVQIAVFQSQAFLADSPEQNQLVAAFDARLRHVPMSQAARAELVERARELVDTVVYPAYRRLLADLEELIADARREAGVGSLPGGDSYYRYILRHHLSIDLSPSEVHQLGLEEVARLRLEIDQELEKLGYTTSEENFGGTLAQAVADTGFWPITDDEAKAELLALNAQIVSEISERVDDVFEFTPNTDLEIVRPPSHREGSAGAWYRSPALDGSRPGIYYLSLGGQAYPKIGVKTTAYHEAIPGHHFQLGLQSELDDAATHQRVLVFTGFAEGWALYAERLAAELGLYEGDPQGNIGRLQMEMLRAVRAVADTGIHDLGWSRSEAIRYVVSNTGFAEQRAAAEVDRYIVWPGQAPAYIVGQRLILDERQRAASELGDVFDIARFHTAILRHGGLPLALLPAAVDQLISSPAG